MARWLQGGGYKLTEWETDLSSQTGASQAGILLGDNHDIPAFRWVDKASGRVVSCSNPGDCAEIERSHSSGVGLLVDGGTSRGNLLSGEADAAILTASRVADEKGANPGYRAFLANGSNVTRTLVLFFWEVVLELVAAARQRRRDVRPRGHRGGNYPLLRAGMCVFVRDLVVVLGPAGHVPRGARGLRDVRQLRRGRPPLRARAPRHARGAAQARPALRHDRAGAPATRRGRTSSWCSPTTGRPRARRSCSATATASPTSWSGRCPAARCTAIDAGDENATGVGRAVDEATGAGAGPESPRERRALAGRASCWGPAISA